MPMERTDPVRFSANRETSRIAVAKLQHSFGERRKIIKPEDPHTAWQWTGTVSHHAPHPSYK